MTVKLLLSLSSFQVCTIRCERILKFWCAQYASEYLKRGIYGKIVITQDKLKRGLDGIRENNKIFGFFMHTQPPGLWWICSVGCNLIWCCVYVLVCGRWGLVNARNGNSSLLKDWISRLLKVFKCHFARFTFGRLPLQLSKYANPKIKFSFNKKKCKFLIPLDEFMWLENSSSFYLLDNKNGFNGQWNCSCTLSWKVRWCSSGWQQHHLSELMFFRRSFSWSHCSISNAPIFRKRPKMLIFDDIMNHRKCYDYELMAVFHDRRVFVLRSLSTKQSN